MFGEKSPVFMRVWWVLRAGGGLTCEFWAVFEGIIFGGGRRRGFGEVRAER